MMYGFTYDGLNRLKGSTHYRKNGSTWEKLPDNTAFDERGLTYDKNGNILTLSRTGALTATQSYTYNGNQLTSLSKNGVAGTYRYDPNGNMINDSRKNLNLSYNVLNLLSTVKTGTSLTAAYSYLADGTKLGVVDASNHGFYYLGSLTYVKNGNAVQLESGFFDGGRITANASTRVGNETRYFLTDHLGSPRVIVNQNGVVEERNDYYPFGGRYAVTGGNVDAGSRWKYNGKEEQVTGNLGWLDYGARMYDWELGRWNCADPLSESYMFQGHYNYCANNPLIFIDPTGNWYTHYVDKNNNLLAQTNDGSEDVVKIPDNAISDFLDNYRISRNDPGRTEKAGWNNYWKDNYGVDRTLNKEELFWINQFRTSWSRSWALRYVLNPNSFENIFMMTLSHGVSLYGSVDGVAMVGMGLSMFPRSVTPKSPPRLYPLRPDVPGTRVPRTLQPGEIIDRYGQPSGYWASPTGTAYEARSIPPKIESCTQYTVIRPIKVQQSLAAPGELPMQWGYGVQYQFSKPILYYLNKGYLK